MSPLHLILRTRHASQATERLLLVLTDDPDRRLVGSGGIARIPDSPFGEERGVPIRVNGEVETMMISWEADR